MTNPNDQHERLVKINQGAKRLLETEGTGKEDVFASLLKNMGQLAALVEEGNRIAGGGK